jgi:PHD/YefM family antitoxin component YafN of YafNO toxin-antitoxin module
MKTVNALTIRNHLGEVLDALDQSGEPILVSKGRKTRAVLISPEDFKRRFVDVQAEEEKSKLLKTIRELKKKKLTKKSSVEMLRELRGYTK